MRMNPGIILSGQPVNAMANFAQGIQAAGMANQIGDNNRLRDVFSTQGAGILAGDQGALDALATAGPQGGQMALGVQRQQQEMEIQRERLAMARQAAAQQAAQFAAGLGEVERQRVVQALSTQAPRAVRAAQQGDVAGFNAIVDPYREVLGFGPAQDEQEMRLQLAAISGMSEGFAAVVEAGGIGQGSELTTANQTLMQRAEMLGLDRGTPEFNEFVMNGGRTPEGMSITTRPDGTMTLVQGPGAGQDEGQMNIASPDAMIASIDGILEDPALDSATGALSWTSNIPGTPMRRFGARADQLDGQAFLQAYNSLRGAGQITEFESQQALRAVGRLDRAQSAEDYRSALLELRNILVTGASRPPGWAEREGAVGGDGQGVPFSTEGAGDIPVVRTPEDYEALLPGMVYRDPQGNLRQRPEAN